MAYTDLNGKSVTFLQSSQEKLNNLIINGGASEGAFYLTNDTHRLYVGRSNDEGKVIPVAVNEGVVTVAAVENLPKSGVNAGEFYYASQENILCVYNGQNFIQINSDTNNINESLQHQLEIINGGSEESPINIAQITTSLTDSEDEVVSDILKIADLTKRNKISVDAENKVLYVEGDKYTVSAALDQTDESIINVSLKSANTLEETKIAFKAGDNVNLELVDGAIVVSSGGTGTTNVSGTAVLNEDGSVQFTITDSSGNTITSSASAPIAYTINGTSYAPGEDLPVYSKDEIDSKMKELDGLIYKGVAGSVALPIAGVEAGWMYMADQEFVLAAEDSATGEQIIVKPGDLVISSGEETNGVITDIAWTYIPSGDDSAFDTQYAWNSDAAANKKTLKQANGAGSEVGSWALEAGTAITVESEDTEGQLVTNIAHANIESTQTTGDSVSSQGTFSAVTGITVNEQGHVTEVVTQEISLVWGSF